MRTQMTMLGPGMYSQSTGPCSECNGSGSQISEKDKCRDCNGKKVVKEKKVLECSVDKGAPHGNKYVFHGESDECPDKEPGDVVIVVNEQPHKVFKRKGADLFMEKEITLLEALTGVNFVINYLDGTKFSVSSPKGQTIKPNSLMTIEDKGLPFHKNPYKYGNLFVLFSVKFPESLDEAQLGQVKTMLSNQRTRNADEDMDCEEAVTLVPFKDEHKNTHAQGGTKAYNSDGEEDDEDPRMQGGARQCTTQ